MKEIPPQIVAGDDVPPGSKPLAISRLWAPPVHQKTKIPLPPPIPTADDCRKAFGLSEECDADIVMMNTWTQHVLKIERLIADPEVLLAY